jgi:hypothetical protein
MSSGQPAGRPASLPGKLASVNKGERDRPGWVSMAAVAWVIDDAPVPANLAWTLLVIARRCDANGRGSYQSIETIAEKAGKSPQQARRDVVRLHGLGLLKLGDQSLVEHLPVGRRPTVYDVALTVKGPKPSRASRNKSGLRTDRTPPMGGTPPVEGTPPTHGSPTPPMGVSGTPPMDGSQRDPLNNHVEKPSLSSPAAAEDGPVEDRERAQVDPKQKPQPDPLPVRLLHKHGITDRAEVDRLIPVIEHMNNVDGPGWWVTTDRNGTLPDRINKARASPSPFTTTARPDWCGNCDQRTRQVEVEGSYGQGLIPARCPTCHPLLPQPAALPRDGRRVSGPEELAEWEPLIRRQEAAERARGVGQTRNKLRGQNTRDGSIDWADPAINKFWPDQPDQPTEGTT